MSALIYFLFREEARELVKGAHGAERDVDLLGGLLQEILNKTGIRDIDALYEYSEDCRIPERISFGLHSGKLFSEIPQDYKNWYYRQSDTDPYVVMAMRGEKRSTAPKM